MSEPIEIPAEAFEPKPLFPEFPDKAVVTEIREWIKDQPTFTWRGHTHTKPTEDEASELRYVADFQLGKNNLAPCPCCTPRHGKFGAGYIAWFPRTSCIRLIGQHCFRALDPDAHETASAEYDERRKREGMIDYLNANLHKRFDAVAAIERAMPFARHFDDLHDIFGEKLKRKLGIDLWPHIMNNGVLVRVAGTSTEVYGQIAGSELLDPFRKSLVPELQSALKSLNEIEAGEIEAMTDAARATAARKFARGINKAKDVFALMRDIRRFVSGVTIATLQGWGRGPNLMGPLYISRNGLTIEVGETEKAAERVRLDPLVDQNIPYLPEVSTA